MAHIHQDSLAASPANPSADSPMTLPVTHPPTDNLPRPPTRHLHHLGIHTYRRRPTDTLSESSTQDSMHTEAGLVPSIRQLDCQGNPYSGTQAGGDAIPHNRKKSFGSQAAGSVRSVFRRASQSLKHHPRSSEPGPSKSRKLSVSHTSPKSLGTSQPAVVEETNDELSGSFRKLSVQNQSRPPTSSSSIGNVLRRATSFRRERRPATSGPSGAAARSYNIYHHSQGSTSYHLHSDAHSAILQHIDPNGGMAARASAAAQNGERNTNTLSKMLVSMRDRSPRSNKESKLGVQQDSESAIFMDMSSPTDDDSVSPILQDPLGFLPLELSSLVLSHLDAKSLAAAEQVSRSWRLAAASPHVWREVFLRKYQQKIHVQPTPLQMGGVGASTIKPGRDWKRLYEMRQRIENNWKLGKPAAIYLSGHTDSVYCCQFDEDKIITGSRDRTIRIWDIHTYKCLKVIGGPENKPVPPTNAQELETHETQTVSALPSVNGTPEGDAIYHVPHDWHSASILCLQFDKDIMVTGSSDSTCIVWDLPTLQPKFRLLKHAAGVLDVCFDSKYIVSCSKDATICVWNRETGELIRQLTGHSAPVNAVQLRGNLLVSASGDGGAKLWNLDSGACVKEFRSKVRGFAAVEFSDDATSILAGGNDQVVYRFDASTSELKHTYEGHSGLVRSLFLDSANGRVLSGSYDQSMRVYDFKTGKEVATYKDWTTSWILAAKCDYRRIVATSQDGRALLMDFGYGIPGVEELRGEGFKA